MAWIDLAWRRRKSLTIDPSQVGIGQGNFPTLVSLSDADLSAFAQASGNDILFTSADGATQLAHDIDTFDKASGVLVAWVLAPLVSSFVDTVFYMYYDNPVAVSQADPGNVWLTDYLVVLHLNEDPSGNGAKMLDSGRYGRDAQAFGDMTSADLVVGKIGTGLAFDGVDDVLRVSGLDTDIIFNGEGSLEVWVKLDSNTPTAAQSGLVDLGNSGAATHYPFTDGTLKLSVLRSTEVISADNSAFDKTAWHLLAITHVDDGETQYRIYQNGVLFEAFADETPDLVHDSTFGKSVGGVYFKGCMDEIRVAALKHTDGWLLLSYTNQSDPAAFMAVGTEELAPMAVQVNRLTAAAQQVLAADPTAILNVQSLVWVGVTTAADTCLVRQINGDPLWEGIANGAATYQGITFTGSAGDGVHARGGIDLITLASGVLYVYVEVP